jgi:hypothetical protein
MSKSKRNGKQGREGNLGGFCQRGLGGLSSRISCHACSRDIIQRIEKEKAAEQE